MKPGLAGLLAAAGALAACADYYPPPPPPPPPPMAAAAPTDGCFRTGDIDRHKVADDRTLYIRVGNRDIFRLNMVAACLSGIGPSDPLIIREAAGAPYACRPLDLDVSVARGGLTSGGGTTPCLVQSMSRLTPDEVAALPDRYRP